jgi:type II protein arginine methyltransferase
MVALAPHLAPDVAIDTIQRALALAPEDAALRAAARRVLGRMAPAWHFLIVADRPRNDAYEAALRRIVSPGCKVLEIGAGTGLLSMMAARAGAGEVIACEADPAIAAAAREIVARNGLADRVRIVAKHSSELDLQQDLGGPADVLVSEIVSNNLLGEAVLPTLEDVVPRLLRPGAAVIPARGRVRVALAHDARWARGRMGTVSGFDLSEFNRFARAERDIVVGEARLALRSAAADLFAFDFASGGPYAAAATSLDLASFGGPVNGIAQWIALDLDPHTTYENRPSPGTRSCWAAVFHPFDRERDTRGGEMLTMHGRHDRQAPWVWIAP